MGLSGAHYPLARVPLRGHQSHLSPTRGRASSQRRRRSSLRVGPSGLPLGRTSDDDGRARRGSITPGIVPSLGGGAQGEEGERDRLALRQLPVRVLLQGTRSSRRLARPRGPPLFRNGPGRRRRVDGRTRRVGAGFEANVKTAIRDKMPPLVQRLTRASLRACQRQRATLNELGYLFENIRTRHRYMNLVSGCVDKKTFISFVSNLAAWGWGRFRLSGWRSCRTCL